MVNNIIVSGTMNDNEFEVIKNKVESSIKNLMKYDSFLLKEDVNERSITHKLTEYLNQEFEEYDVDCEYNRMCKDNSIIPKRMKSFVEPIRSSDTEAKRVYPDIIIHKRENEDNLLVIEVKKVNNNSNMKTDKEKLKSFTLNINNGFSYRFGLHLRFYVGENDYKLLPEGEWYEDGKIMEKMEFKSKLI